MSVNIEQVKNNPLYFLYTNLERVKKFSDWLECIGEPESARMFIPEPGTDFVNKREFAGILVYSEAEISQLMSEHPEMFTPEEKIDPYMVHSIGKHVHWTAILSCAASRGQQYIQEAIEFCINNLKEGKKKNTHAKIVQPNSNGNSVKVCVHTSQNQDIKKVLSSIRRFNKEELDEDVAAVIQALECLSQEDAFIDDDLVDCADIFGMLLWSEENIRAQLNTIPNTILTSLDKEQLNAFIHDVNNTVDWQAVVAETKKAADSLILVDMQEGFRQLQKK